MIHINRFLDKINSCETKRMKDLTISMKDAKNLHSDITKLLLALQELQKPADKVPDDEVQKIEITGGEW